MNHLQQAFSVRFEYNVFFTHKLFEPSNPVFRDFLRSASGETTKKIFFVIDSGVMEHHPGLRDQITQYFSDLPSLTLIKEMMIAPGGESCKNTEQYFYEIVRAVDRFGIDRHSYIAAIGGGAVLDLAGYAAAVSHRGIRHIRIPTTVLSQNDSGVGVKNGINFLGKKNFLGSFAPPVAVFNDFSYLTTLSDADWRSGISEAVKVALIKDSAFFEWIKQRSAALANRDMDAMQYLIKRCAALHMEHIGGGDPFEMGSSRPLDFGHWSAHKVEQLSEFSIRHGEAVAMGIALDSAYSFLSGMLKEEEARDILDVLTALGFAVRHPLMDISDRESPVLKGLNEFREHLGGRLTIMLLSAIGRGEETHDLDTDTLIRSSQWVASFSSKH